MGRCRDVARAALALPARCSHRRGRTRRRCRARALPAHSAHAGLLVLVLLAGVACGGQVGGDLSPTCGTKDSSLAFIAISSPGFVVAVQDNGTTLVEVFRPK